jgi:hypothetical protein
MNKLILIMVTALTLIGCASNSAYNRLADQFQARLDRINAMPPGPERDRLGRQYNSDLATAKAMALADLTARRQSFNAMMASSQPMPVPTTTTLTESRPAILTRPRIN